MDYTEHKDVLKRREAAQTAEKDRRELARVCRTAMNEPDGFWEQDIINKWDGKPKYSVNVAQARLLKKYGDLAQQEIQINIKPAQGGDKKTAATMCGLMKAIELQSRAELIYKRNLLRAMIAGFGAVLVETDYADDYSFNQELFIRDIPDAINRVWFFGNWQLPTAEDAEAVTIDYMVDEDEFKETFELDRKCKSLGTDAESNHYYHKREGDIVSRLFYKRFIPETIYQSPTGQVFSEEDYKELASAGVDVSGFDSRNRKIPKVFTRWYDADGWLNDEEETVFDTLPVSPIMPFFDVVENTPIWFGDVQNVLDQQRILNYTISKKVADEVLNAKKKIWVSKDQINDAKAAQQIKTYNTNNDPIQIWVPQPDQPAPFEIGGGAASPAMDGIVGMMMDGISQTMGLTGVQEGINQGQLAFESIQALQSKGEVGSLPYFDALKTFVLRIGEICVGSMAAVYDTPMTKRIIGEGGNYEMAELNKTIMTPNGEAKINDLSAGTYDVYCDIGMAHSSKKEQASKYLIELGSVAPDVIEIGKDILVDGVSLPGMDKLAERIRQQMVMSGQIPDGQLSDEERAMVEQMRQQPQQPDPMAIVAEAEATKAQAGVQKVQAETQLAVIKAEQAQQKMDFEQELQKLKLMEEQNNNMVKNQAEMVKMLNTMANTLNLISQSMGADAIVSPDAAQAYQATADNINDFNRQI